MAKKLKHLFYNVWLYVRWPYDWLVAELAFRKKIKELKKKDPFIYK